MTEGMQKQLYGVGIFEDEIVLADFTGKGERRFVVSPEQLMSFFRTEVTFRPLDAVAIRKYLTQVDPLDKAGAYAIQEHGDWLVASLAGSYSNVIGLPLDLLPRLSGRVLKDV